jgi:hypothetical protein
MGKIKGWTRREDLEQSNNREYVWTSDSTDERVRVMSEEVDVDETYYYTFYDVADKEIPLYKQHPDYEYGVPNKEDAKSFAVDFLKDNPRGQELPSPAGWTVEEQGYNFYVLKPENSERFTCQIDGREVELVIAAELMNLKEIYGEPIVERDGESAAPNMTMPDHFNWVVEFQIMPQLSELSDSHRQDAKQGDNPLNYNDLYRYSGGVPVNLFSMVNPDEAIALPHIEGESVDNSGEIIQFPQGEDAEDFIKTYAANRAGAVAGMIGFVLDKPINQVGTTGWDDIQDKIDDNYDKHDEMF